MFLELSKVLNLFLKLFKHLKIMLLYVLFSMWSMERSGKNLCSIVNILACDFWGITKYSAFKFIQGLMIDVISLLFLRFQIMINFIHNYPTAKLLFVFVFRFAFLTMRRAKPEQRQRGKKANFPKYLVTLGECLVRESF